MLRRLVFGMVIALGSLFLIFFFRQAGVAVMVFMLQALIYKEVVSLAISDARESAINAASMLPPFNMFYTWWFLTAAVFAYGKTLQAPLLNAVNSVTSSGARGSTLLRALELLLSHYVLVAFTMYTLGFVAFVISLQRRRNFRYQFSQLAYCHMALLVVVFQSTLLVSNAFQGILWFFLPCALVAQNDTAAYFFGVAFGRTPLIKLSPKKTWEGFIGGAVATLAFAVAATGFLRTVETFHIREILFCPVGENIFEVPTCEIEDQALGLYKPFPLSEFWFGSAIPAALANVKVTEMQLHSLSLAAFASAVAPFGGFFASGFKRAFHIKDFGTSIPGHGGFTDRMDCQIVMGSFAYVYAHYFLQLGMRGDAVIGTVARWLVHSLPTGSIHKLLSIMACYLQAVATSPGGVEALSAPQSRALIAACISANVTMMGDAGSTSSLPAVPDLL